MYRDGRGTDKNVAEALKFFMSAAIQGNANSMLSIIRMHDAGQADTETFEYALRRLEQIAEGGNVIAIRTLGNMYLEGKSVPKNNEEAKRWFEKSAKLGDAFSRNKLKSLE
jgi:TPR repeat protein